MIIICMFDVAYMCIGDEVGDFFPIYSIDDDLICTAISVYVGY